MLNIIRKIFIILVLITSQLSSQDNSLVNDDSHLLSRSRIQFGYSHLVQKGEKPEFQNYFLNLNYRWSEFDSFAKPFRIKGSFEVGMVGAKVKDDSFIILLPYLKGGPEMSLTKNLFIGGSVGIASLLFYYLSVAPFAGINIFYFIPLNKNLFFETELGYHTTFFYEKAPYMIYFSTGIAFK